MQPMTRNLAKARCTRYNLLKSNFDLPKLLSMFEGIISILKIFEKHSSPGGNFTGKYIVSKLETHYFFAKFKTL